VELDIFVFILNFHMYLIIVFCFKFNVVGFIKFQSNKLLLNQVISEVSDL